MIRERLLTPNPFSRPGFPMRGIQAIALHWVGTAGHDADTVWGWWESLRKQDPKALNPTYASAQYIVDEDEVVRCIPEDEVAYAVGPWKDKTTWADTFFRGDGPNYHTISVEMCHPGSDGVPTRRVLERTRALVVGLVMEYDLDPMGAIIRHFDVTGKECPLWMVRHPDTLVEFRAKVARAISILKEA